MDLQTGDDQPPPGNGCSIGRRLLASGCGCDRVFLDGKALIIVRATGAVLDLINLF